MSVEDLRAWLNEWHARLAAEAQAHALREALTRANMWVSAPREAMSHEKHQEYVRDVKTIRAALTLPPGDALRALVTRAVEVACERGMRDAFWPRTEADWEQVVDDVLGKAGSGRRASDERSEAMSVVDGQTYQVVKLALEQGHNLILRYGGKQRVVTPWLLGKTNKHVAAGESALCLHAYQVTADGVNDAGWRYFYLDYLEPVAFAFGEAMPQDLAKKEQPENLEPPRHFIEVIARRQPPKPINISMGTEKP